MPKPPSHVLEYRMAWQVLSNRCNHSLTVVQIVRASVSGYITFTAAWSAK